MKIDQAEIASMSDVEIKRLAVWLSGEFPEDDGRPQRDLMRGFSFALVRALRERDRTLALLECELLNADVEAGAQLEDGTTLEDLERDALNRLREEPPT